MFNKLYGHYKDVWDMEMIMAQSNTTYKKAYIKFQKDQEWF